ncbi:tyrosine-type recombinase/integrase [Solidesulfovibrio carbinolicus]|uniref:Integrase n=1 Tax=Solidesulfovibrio carbinolicus TaxID=296842 RepID=A0A4P6HQU1_9BACT|nr:tyrosine-type recombinase/integrase [Solidesulfovibrio carbinolicus]QAZ69683.1 integrase [Solidesulfovibrio carbinolicus]
MSAKTNRGNNPKAGEVITVEPIKSVKDIATIKKLLADKPRESALFVVGINTALRASDLLKLTAGQVRTILADEDGGLVRESKTGKRRRVIFNKAAREALARLLATREFDAAEPIFTGQRGQMSASYLCRLVASWCESVNLKGNYGSHSLRKTWGYHQRVTFGADIPTLMDALGHSTQRQTLTYLCIQPEEIKSVYANEL